MREAFDRRRRRCTSCSAPSPGCRASNRRAPSTPSRPSKGSWAARSAGRRPETTLELAEVLLEEAAVAIVPGEAFGAPGYARLSYALGDDELVEGLTRMAEVLGGVTAWVSSGAACRSGGERSVLALAAGAGSGRSRRPGRPGPRRRLGPRPRSLPDHRPHRPRSTAWSRPGSTSPPPGPTARPRSSSAPARLARLAGAGLRPDPLA